MIDLFFLHGLLEPFSEVFSPMKRTGILFFDTSGHPYTERNINLKEDMAEAIGQYSWMLRFVSAWSLER